MSRYENSFLLIGTYRSSTAGVNRLNLRIDLSSISEIQTLFPGGILIPYDMRRKALAIEKLEYLTGGDVDVRTGSSAPAKTFNQ